MIKQTNNIPMIHVTTLSKKTVTMIHTRKVKFLVFYGPITMNMYVNDKKMRVKWPLNNVEKDVCQTLFISVYPMMFYVSQNTISLEK